MKIKRKNIVGLYIMIAEVVFIIGIFSIMTLNSTMSILKEIGMIAFGLMILTLATLYFVRPNSNFLFFFILLTYLFSFGQSILIAFDVELPVSAFSILYSGFDVGNLKDSSEFVLISICMIVIGFFITKAESIEVSGISTILVNGERMNGIGWVLLYVSVLPTLYLLYKDIIGTYSIGYGSTLKAYTGVERICSLISGFFISGILITVCFERRKLHRKIIYSIILIYCLLQILGGSRIAVFRFAVVFFVLANCYFKVVNKKTLLQIIIIGLIGVFIFSVVSASRIYVYNITDIPKFLKEVAQEIWENNFLIASLREMGNTQIINTLVYSKCPSQIPFQFGLSFLKMLWAIFPNLIGTAFTGYIGVDITFSGLYTKTNAGLGASYIAEGYWNFGWFAIFYFILLGYFLGCVEGKFYDACNSTQINAATLFALVYVMYYMIFMVRSELIGFGRAFVYYVLVPITLSKIQLGDLLGRGNSRSG